MRESSCKKMMREIAAPDRIIVGFPRPQTISPYNEMDFDPKVKEVCAMDRAIRIGLKISKVIFVGDVGVGKTCLVNRFCHEVFNADYKATIGVDFEVERFDVLNTPFNLQIWDTAGQERFRCIAAAYYRGAHVVVITFDLSNLYSLHNARTWLQQTLENLFDKPLVFLVGTKKDLIGTAAFEAVEKEAIKVSKSISAEYWAVSSKSGENVKDFFFRLAALAFNRSVLKEYEDINKKEITGSFVKLNKTNGNTFEIHHKTKCGSGCKV